MKYDLPAPKLRALPVQVIELGQDVILKRGRLEVKVSGAGAALVVERLLALLNGEGRTRQELHEQFAAPDRPAIDALLSHLLNKRFLTEGGPPPALDEPESSLDVFYWHFGTTASKVRSTLSDKRFLIVGVNRISRQLAATLQTEAQGQVELVDVPVLRDLSLFNAEGALLENRWPSMLQPVLRDVADSSRIDPARFDCLIATCEQGGQTCLRQWNEFCVLHQRHFLPVFLQDLIGYVGPLVVPRETACFECLRLRQDSHLADPMAYRAAETVAAHTPAAGGFHPSMATLVAEIAVFELIRFYGVGWPWWRVGTLIELNMLASSMTTHKVMRLPRCPVCTTLHERAPSK